MILADPAPPPSRSARLRGEITRRWPLLVGVLFWVLLPVLALVAIGMGADRLAVRLNDMPAGVRGTFDVTGHNCQQDLCVTSGTFTSDDGTIREADLLGDYRWQFGYEYQVVYERSAPDVVPLPAVWDPTSTLVGMGGAAVFLGLWGWCVRAELRRRRAGAAVASTRIPAAAGAAGQPVTADRVDS